ncbi:uncharacterized protein LOC130699159 isoform X2 [Daphnia carinata]|uniref:uncharacterized protein LOC130699159 isoform X2 n=1 Tax=Daphnia carinata TaxID=120202 RepID=UPI002868A970|nr:uncharacterized protein LOC130699159 isoform X2 [Daphnia carinata]
MDSFPLPVFNLIESEDEEDHEVLEVQEVKSTRYDHLHKLLNDRSLSLPTHNPNTILKKLEAIAEENLLKKDLKETCCTLPGNPRSTFLMVFSPDGSKVASSHGDHNINVTDLRTSKCISTLTGHPRTPWCIAFHPHRNDILASGCLGGQVRVWDLSGGSEMWSVTATEVTTVIASLAFHPSERLLVIATNSTLYFWDWNIPQPFAKCSTANEKQKLRYVSFDPLGNWLLTGISNTFGTSASFAPGTTSSLSGSSLTLGGPGQVTHPINYRMERNEQERERNLQSRYQTLLDQYERLRVRYQELRHRAAELELNASSSQSTSTGTVASFSMNNDAPSSAPTVATINVPVVEQSTINRTSPPLPTPDTSLLNTSSSSDRFWRTLMNAAENLRALSNIGRTLNTNQRQAGGPAEGPSRSSGASLDQDARMRIQLLSRHIENMQRICRSHLEMTRHRRQVYRLQQIRRILEDLREQIRYLQVCVRDSLDLVSRLRTSPAGSSTSLSAQRPTSSHRESTAFANNRETAGTSTAGSNHEGDLQFTSNGRMVMGSRAYSPIQCRRFTNYLFGRLRRIGLQHHRDNPRLRHSFVAGREARYPIRLGLYRGDSSSLSGNPVEQIDPQPGPSRDYSMGTECEFDEVMPNLERGLGSSSNSFGWRRSRFSRMSRRNNNINLMHPTHRSNSLLHTRHSGIQRRKPSLLSRIFHGRTLQNQIRSLATYHSTLESTAPVNLESGRPSDQSLRPLMERLESHFRLQRQTMGILAQLNEAAVANGIGSNVEGNNPTPAATPGENSVDGGGLPTASFSDSSVSSRGGPWASNVLHSIRHFRARRDAFERARSFESRLSSNSNADRFQPPRRMDSNIGIPPRFRPSRPFEDEDSSDTDTDVAAESANPAANRWRQSSPIRSPRGVEQRMRLLWREYLSQVVHVQLNSMGESTSQQPGTAQESGDNDQERTRYRLWLSTMVESLTSFFSQHGINSSDSADATPPPPTPSTPITRPLPGTPLPSRPGSSSAAGQSFPYVSRFSNAMRDEGFIPATEEGPTSPVMAPRSTAGPHHAPPPWRVFPRVGHGMGGIGGSAGVSFGIGGADQGPGQQRWNLRRNAESQVSLSAHLTYRIQAWDFCAKDGFIPDIRDPHANIVVPESKIHNDASVDVSADGRFLVTLVPCTSLTGALISLHSLEPSRLGLCLAQVNVDQFVVSVSISPTCRHLLLGLASSRALSVTSRDHALPTLWAQVYQIPIKVFQTQRNGSSAITTTAAAASSTSGAVHSVVGDLTVEHHQSSRQLLEKKPSIPPPQGSLLHVRDLSQTADVGLTSLNCIRWIPTAGQGFVLGTNKGHLKVIG